MFAPRISHTAGRRGQPRDAASSLQRHSPLAGAQARREDVPEDRQKQRSSGTDGGGLTGPLSPAAPIVPMPRPHAVRLQTKLRIGSTTDPLESDADRVADQVMRMGVTNIPSTGPNQIRRKCAQCQREDDAVPSTPPQLQRKCAACEEEEAHLQKKPDHASESPSLRTEAPPLVHQVLRSPGQPLAKDDLAFFTSRFGFDFSRVRIHNDRTAAESAHSVNALAYTAGSDIAFADGQYQPGTESGRRLIAHELTHVVQQGSAARTRGDATLGVQRDNAGNALRRVHPGART